jgi:autoinducer 2-degrading protein
MSAFVLAVRLDIKPDCVNDFMAGLLENAKSARETEPGCRQFDVPVDPSDATKVMLYEVYDSAAAFEAHQQTAHFKKYIEKGIPLLAARERTFYSRLAP